MDLDPLETYLLESLRALPAGGGGDAAQAEAIWRAQVRSRLCDFAARDLQSTGRSFYSIGRRARVERGRRARAAADGPGAPPLPLRRLLPRARRAGGPGRGPGHPPRRHGRAGRADRGRPPQGFRQPRARRHPADVDDRVAPAACRRRRVCDRAGEEARRRVGLAHGRGRRLQLRRRLRQPRGRAGGPEQRRAPRAPGAAAAAPLRLRGQPARDQRPLARGLGRVGAPRPAGASLRGRAG